ncbi:O-antigen ligase family protein [Marinobacter alexandrii]|uniref:O-antigen ligase family protein n=1 Tax=Marinobacter alexandrii TaxID=2570351 RepID=UPI001109D047|nr:O-antigen ligase family protein [Marinobacter alexandrii]
MTNNIKSVVGGRTFSLVMFSCVLGFVLFKRLYRDLGDIFLFFFVLGTIVSVYYNFRWVKKDPVFIAFFLSLTVPVLSWLNSKIQIPELAKDSPSPFFFYDFFFFWFIAYWTNGRSERIVAILFCYCLSVLGIYLSHSPDLAAEIRRGLSGTRIDFHLVNAQHTSLFAGFGLIASSFLLVAKSTLTRNIEVGKKLLSLTFVVFFTLVIVITQSRQVWLALAACVLFYPIALKLLLPSRTSTRKMLATYAVLVLLLAGAANLNIIENRLNAEGSTITRITNLDLDSVSDSGSIGVRLHLWFEAWEWIMARPLLGSGEDAREIVISESKDLPDFVRADFTHLHNSHIETFVSFGIIGSVLVYFLMIYPTYRIVVAPPNSIRKTWRIFSLVVLAFWMTVNLFESYLYSANGIYIFSVFFGIIYSFKFGQQSDEIDNNQENPRKKHFCQT